MELYTTNIRLEKPVRLRGVQTLNITVKSGDERLAPTWDLLTRYRSETIDWQGYITEFVQQMSINSNEHYDFWKELCISKEPIAFYCYCPKYKRCHRWILVKLFEQACRQLGTPFIYRGEITGVPEDAELTTIR